MKVRRKATILAVKGNVTLLKIKSLNKSFWIPTTDFKICNERENNMTGYKQITVELLKSALPTK